MLRMNRGQYPQLVWSTEKPRQNTERRVHWLVSDQTINYIALVVGILFLALVLMWWYGLNNGGGLQ